MDLGYNKNFTLYLRTQYNPSTGRKLRKDRKKIQEDWGHLQLSFIGKEMYKPGHAK